MSALGQARYKAAWATGRDLTLEQILNQALKHAG